MRNAFILKKIMPAVAFGLSMCCWSCAAPSTGKLSRLPERQANVSVQKAEKSSARSVERRFEKRSSSDDEMIAPSARNRNSNDGEESPQAAGTEGMPSRTETDTSTSSEIFHYDYYPEAGVYFDIHRHLYFYRKDRGWTMSVALPTVFKENLGRSVRIKSDVATPYERHRKHRERYPPER